MEKLRMFLKAFSSAGFKLTIPLVMAAPILLAGCQDKNYAKVPEESAKDELQEVKAEPTQEDLVARGNYLVTTIGCADCHSPKKMGERGPEEIPELKLSGFQQDTKLPPINQEAIKQGWMLMTNDITAAVGPWGVSFAANLTSDETGIGNWSFEQFRTAMQEGKYKGLKDGRDILPPMPWPNFAHLTEKDLKAMFAYLQSTEPVKNAVPAPIPPNKLSTLGKK
jgi:mono/diheme cytochrome c family protein